MGLEVVLHLMVRTGSVFPAESSARTESWEVCPTRSVSEDGSIVTVFTVAVDIVIRALSTFPFTATRIQAVPGPTPVARPSGVTVAAAGLDDVQEGEHRTLGVPPPSRTVAVSVT
jgi:hypothetical protein